jgi:hypothetical protein
VKRCTEDNHATPRLPEYTGGPTKCAGRKNPRRANLPVTSDRRRLSATGVVGTVPYKAPNASYAARLSLQHQQLNIASISTQLPDLHHEQNCTGAAAFGIGLGLATPPSVVGEHLSWLGSATRLRRRSARLSGKGTDSGDARRRYAGRRSRQERQDIKHARPTALRLGPPDAGPYCRDLRERLPGSGSWYEPVQGCPETGPKGGGWRTRTCRSWACRRGRSRFRPFCGTIVWRLAQRPANVQVTGTSNGHPSQSSARYRGHRNHRDLPRADPDVLTCRKAQPDTEGIETNLPVEFLLLVNYRVAKLSPIPRA